MSLRLVTRAGFAMLLAASHAAVALQEGQPAQTVGDRIVGFSPLTAGPVTLRDPSHSPCGVVRHIAWATRISMGCEDRIDASRIDPSALSSTVLLTGLTVNDALAKVIGVYPEYAWSEDNNVIVVRPKKPEPNRDRLLATRIPAAVIGVRAGVPETLQLLLKAFGWRQPFESAETDPEPFEIEFRGGSVVDLLNSLVRTRPDIFWHVTDLIPSNPEQPPLKEQMYVDLGSLRGGGGGALLPNHWPPGRVPGKKDEGR